MEASLNGNDFGTADATFNPFRNNTVQSGIGNKKARPKPGLCCSICYLELRPAPTGAKAEAEAGGDADVVLRRRSMTSHEVIEPRDYA
jgi:hypothetical protein